MSEAQEEYRQSRFRRPPGACEILLVRHGESAAAIPGQDFPMVEGHGDPPLHPVGLDQAERVADRLELEPISAIYVTTLTRTHQTAAPLAARLGIEPMVEPELREVHLGEWEGGEYRRQAALGNPIFGQVWKEQRWDLIPGAEPAEQFAARCRVGIERIAGAHPDQVVVAVVHGGVIGQVLALATGCGAMAFATADNASISHVVVHGDRWFVRRYNDTGHLQTHFTDAPEPLV